MIPVCVGTCYGVHLIEKRIYCYYYYFFLTNLGDCDVQNIVVITVRKIDSDYLNILKHVYRYKASATRRCVCCCTTVRLNSY